MYTANTERKRGKFGWYSSVVDSVMPRTRLCQLESNRQNWTTGERRPWNPRGDPFELIQIICQRLVKLNPAPAPPNHHLFHFEILLLSFRQFDQSRGHTKRLIKDLVTQVKRLEFEGIDVEEEILDRLVPPTIHREMGIR